MKKLINKPETVVDEMCRGIEGAHPNLFLDKRYRVIRRANLNQDKVSLISGGGSGHEPAHAGLVGKGMLDAAVCGDVFASPSQVQVYQAIKQTAGNKGTLLIIKNYSGDMMNFKNALYMAREDGIDVDYVKVDDDIAVMDSLYTVGRRGVAGTVLVHKVAGAAAERGEDLTKVKAVAQKAIENVKSLGFAFSPCTPPAKGTPIFELKEDEMEFGIGIHGEPGISKEKIQDADTLARRITEALLKELSYEEQTEMAVLVNGFGGTPLQELYLFFNSVRGELANRNIKVPYVLVGNYMTSIELAGASLSLMKLDSELKELLFADCDTPALKSFNRMENHFSWEKENDGLEEEYTYEIETDKTCGIIKGNMISLENIVYMVDCMSESAIRNEVAFCELDSHAGDGDFGMSIAKGFRQLKKEWKYLMEHHSTSIGDFLEACSFIIMEYCGGASGPIWGSAFRGAGKYASDARGLTKDGFAAMLQQVVNAIQVTGERSFGRGAVVGDKTLMDALIPCADCFEDMINSGEALEDAFRESSKAAVFGANATKNFTARMGRAGTVGKRSIGYPDAGAFGLGVIFTDIVNNLVFVQE